MIFSVNRIVGSVPLRSALIFFAATLACPSWSSAQGTATGASGNPTAAVVGGCNVVQQNVAATGEAAIINEINCVPEKPEDSFLLRYLWLDATTSSFLVAGRFDPVLARVLPGTPIVARNPVFQRLQDIVTRFGRIDSPKTAHSKCCEVLYTYTLIGSKGRTEIEPSDIQSKLRIYTGEENIILPDVSSLQAVFKTQEWPSNYKMTYQDRPLGSSPDWEKPQAHVDFQNGAISCVLLHAPVPASLLMNYWELMAELETLVLKKRFRAQEVINRTFAQGQPPPENFKASMLNNKSIDAMLYFGQRGWPDDFLLGFGGASVGDCGAEYAYNFGFYAVPRQLFTLVAVIEPRFKDLQIEHIGYVADLDEQLRLLRVGTQVQDSPPGVITLKKGEMAVIPLRIELRYNLDEEYGEFRTLSDVSSADSIYQKIKNATLSTIQFKAKDDRSELRAQGPLRPIFSKSISSFRPPETREINRTYIFGPAYNLKTITIKGKDIPVRSAPAAAVAFIANAEAGSCPFLYVSDGNDDPSRVGRILIGASKQEYEKVEEIKLPRETRSLFLSEQEPEVTFLESVVLKNASSGEERLVASNLVIHPGQAREFRIPEEFYGDAILKIRGYYMPLRFDQNAEVDGATNGQTPH